MLKKFGLVFVYWLVPLTASWVCGDEPLAPASSDKLPNVIVIMADDLGYGDVSCYGATEIETPNIDRLASEGRRFTSGYCSASTCTPTRYSFLTGNYAFRKTGTGIAPPNGPAIIQPGTETVASILQRTGYKTTVIGKWHLELGPKGRKHLVQQDNGDQGNFGFRVGDWKLVRHDKHSEAR